MKRFVDSARSESASALGVVLVFASAFLGGCETQNSAVTQAKSGKLFAVTAEHTSFYRYGPQQGNGPDETLPKDTLMTVIRPSFGYSKVQLMNGSQDGYVASEDIRPAPPTLVAALTAPPRQTSTINAEPEREDFDIRSSEPPPPETLPDPDLPPAAPEPSP